MFEPVEYPQPCTFDPTKTYRIKSEYSGLYMQVTNYNTSGGTEGAFQLKDFSPIDENGTSFVDHYYTKAYLRHLFIAGEMLAAQIASEHNLAFYLDVVNQARKHIEMGDFYQWKEMAVKKLQQRL
mgnify:CR=1 FL=1